MRAGCRSSGAVAGSAAAGRATRAVANGSAGSPGRAWSSLQIRSPSAVTGMSARSIERPSLQAASSDMCGRSSCQTPAPMTVSGFGAETLARTRRGPPPSAGSNTACTWAWTAVGCSCRSMPSGSRRPVAVPGRRRAGRAGQRQQHRARPQVGPAAHRDALEGRARAGRAELGGEAVEQRGQPAQRRVGQHRGDDLRRSRRPRRCRGPASRSGPGRTARSGRRQAGSPAAAPPGAAAVVLGRGGGRSPPRPGPSARRGRSRAARCGRRRGR